MNFKKIAIAVSVLLIAGLIVYGYLLYRDIFSPNTRFSENEVAIYIPTNADFNEVKTIVAPYVENMERFVSVAGKKSYPQNVKAGKFVLKKGMNSNDLVTALRQPVPVRVSFNNQERLEDLAGRIAAQIEADSISLLESFYDERFLSDNELTRDNVLSMFIPNSYEFFWNTSALQFRDRMEKEYRKFWTQTRLDKAAALGLTPLEVSALASIVHKETVKIDERPRVAGVYLNRLEKGMKLEADPTVIYAIKRNNNDFNILIKRVLNRDLLTESPFNTYQNHGVPPGPIAMPDISAIDAVLNPESHNYIYFCASVENFGYHEFAVTHAQHERNRQKYVRWISQQGIKR